MKPRRYHHPPHYLPPFSASVHVHSRQTDRQTRGQTVRVRRVLDGEHPGENNRPWNMDENWGRKKVKAQKRMRGGILPPVWVGIGPDAGQRRECSTHSCCQREKGGPLLEERSVGSFSLCFHAVVVMGVCGEGTGCSSLLVPVRVRRWWRTRALFSMTQTLGASV